MKHTRLLVEAILRNPLPFKWSVQGLGMMRVYLSKETRLHIWDSALKVPGVSALHTHPWGLNSLVVAGVYKQHRYLEYTTQEFPNADMTHVGTYNKVQIQCGEKACVIGEPTSVQLLENFLETYPQGCDYWQKSNEIHLSTPVDGTVTIVDRTFQADTEHANIYWRGRGPWVDAKPREATPAEVNSVTARALETWF